MAILSEHGHGANTKKSAPRVSEFAESDPLEDTGFTLRRALQDLESLTAKGGEDYLRRADQSAKEKGRGSVSDRLLFWACAGFKGTNLTKAKLSKPMRVLMSYLQKRHIEEMGRKHKDAQAQGLLPFTVPGIGGQSANLVREERDMNCFDCIRDFAGRTPLAVACLNLDEGMVDRLLGAGASPFQGYGYQELVKNADGTTTAQAKNSQNVLLALCSAKIKTERTTDAEAHKRLLSQTNILNRLLMASGGILEVNSVDSNGRTPIMRALANPTLNASLALNLLPESDCYAADQDGRTFLDVLLSRPFKLEEFPVRQFVIKSLLQENSQVFSRCDKSGVTPLMLAMPDERALSVLPPDVASHLFNESLGTVCDIFRATEAKYLLQRDLSGNTVLSRECLADHTRGVGMLLRLSASEIEAGRASIDPVGIDMVNNDFLSPLAISCLRNSRDNVFSLVCHGASADQPIYIKSSIKVGEYVQLFSEAASGSQGQQPLPLGFDPKRSASATQEGFDEVDANSLEAVYLLMLLRGRGQEPMMWLLLRARHSPEVLDATLRMPKLVNCAPISDELEGYMLLLKHLWSNISDPKLIIDEIEDASAVRGFHAEDGSFVESALKFTIDKMQYRWYICRNTQSLYLEDITPVSKISQAKEGAEGQVAGSNSAEADFIYHAEKGAGSEESGQAAGSGEGQEGEKPSEHENSAENTKKSPVYIKLESKEFEKVVRFISSARQDCVRKNDFYLPVSQVSVNDLDEYSDDFESELLDPPSPARGATPLPAVEGLDSTADLTVLGGDTAAAPENAVGSRIAQIPAGRGETRPSNFSIVATAGSCPRENSALAQGSNVNNLRQQGAANAPGGMTK